MHTGTDGSKSSSFEYPSEYFFLQKNLKLYLMLFQSVKLGTHKHAKHWRTITFPHWLCKSTLGANRKAANHEKWGCLAKGR